MKREVTSYTDDYKLKVVPEYLKSDATMNVLPGIFGLQIIIAFQDDIQFLLPIS